MTVQVAPVVRDRCLGCGRTLSDELVERSALREGPCCNLDALPPVWSRDEVGYPDDVVDREDQDWCSDCEYQNFVATFTAEDGVIYTRSFDESDMCDDCGIFHLFADQFVDHEGEAFPNGSPMGDITVRCANCGTTHTGIEWDA